MKKYFGNFWVNLKDLMETNKQSTQELLLNDLTKYKA
jgi:hypothetical protein